MLEQVRAILQSVSGVAEIPRQQAERIARDLARQTEATASMISSLAEDIVSRSRQNAEMVRALVVSEVRRQIKGVGLATRDDFDRLARRVRDLENAAKPRPTTAKPKRPAKPKATS